MNNQFKSSSRFSILSTENNDNKSKIDGDKRNNIKEDNRFSSSEKGTNSFQSFRRGNDYNRSQNFSFETKKSQEMREQEENRIKEANLRRKEEDTKKALAEENFPVLGISNKTNISEIKPQMQSFLSKVNFIKEEIEDIKEDYVEPGWVQIKRNPITNKIITTYGPSTIFENKEVETEHEIGLRIVNSLVALHEKRTKKYIDMWGYDDYEKQFLFPNYDYGYFDRLDEAYEYQMEMELAEQTKYDSDNDY